MIFIPEWDFDFFLFEYLKLEKGDLIRITIEKTSGVNNQAMIYFVKVEKFFSNIIQLPQFLSPLYHNRRE